MRRISVLTIAGLLCVSALYAQTEVWTSVGFEYGNFFENYDDNGETLETTMASPGICYSEYKFTNNSVNGSFSHASFLFPKSGSSFDGATTVKVDYSDFDLIIQLGLIAGPGFRFRINNMVHTYLGFGISFLQSLAMYESAGSANQIDIMLLGFNFGAGGNIGIKLNITESLYVDVGITGSYDFIYVLYSSVYSSESSDSNFAFDVSFDGDHTMISARPYIALGFNIRK